MSDAPEIRYFFIRRPIFSAVVAIVIVLLGLFALVTLPLNRYPQITPPVVQVTVENARSNIQGVHAVIPKNQTSGTGINGERVHSHSPGDCHRGINGHRRGLIGGKMDSQSVRLPATGSIGLGTAVLSSNHRAGRSAVKQHFVAPGDTILEIRPGDTAGVKVETKDAIDHPIGALI